MPPTVSRTIPSRSAGPLVYLRPSYASHTLPAQPSHARRRRRRRRPASAAEHRARAATHPLARLVGAAVSAHHLLFLLQVRKANFFCWLIIKVVSPRDRQSASKSRKIFWRWLVNLLFIMEEDRTQSSEENNLASPSASLVWPALLALVLLRFRREGSGWRRGRSRGAVHPAMARPPILSVVLPSDTGRVLSIQSHTVQVYPLPYLLLMRSQLYKLVMQFGFES
jgi:hypothetical protein